jgi:cyclopropane fatty-acyl-phospholipid synthase-like methyltransferase
MHAVRRRDDMSDDPPNLTSLPLYNHHRALKILDDLSDPSKPTYKPGRWTREDTESFECLHYLGDAALDHAASELRLQPGQTVLDIGSGYSSTGRYLHDKYGVDVVGIELQSNLHSIAQKINEKTGMEKHVWSINADFLTLTFPDDRKFDAVMSLLAILHIPDRPAVFQQVARMLKPDGSVYIEDYYASAILSQEESDKVKATVQCSDLPSRRRYLDEMSRAGFSTFIFMDVSLQWLDFTAVRAHKYRRETVEAYDEELARFYREVSDMFLRGEVGGCRITAY